MESNPSCCQSKKVHACSCQSDVSACPTGGIVIQSDAPSVQAHLSSLFPYRDGRIDLFTASGDESIERVEGLLGVLSPMERRSINAAILDSNGVVDPWSNAPIEKILRRIKTPWLPGVLNDEQLRFEMQPIVDAYTFKVLGFEALMRCSDSSLNVSPFDLIEAAKAHDALLKLDQVARRNAIIQCAPKLQGEELLFVNFLPLTVYDPDVCLRTTFKAAQDAGLPFGRITFEVVESEEFPDIVHLSEILAKYREVGSRVALDDLGSGNTSLTYVDRLNPDYIKIDREIIANAAANDEPSMLRGLVAHAKDRGIKVLGEGVETVKELDMLREMGVDLIQGYLIAKPSSEPVRSFDQQLPRLAA